MSTESTNPNLTDEMLAAFALGELPQGVVEQVRAAVAGSPKAAARLAALRSTAAVLSTAKLHEPPEAMVQRALRLMVSPQASPHASWLTRAADMAARILFDSFATPAVAGLRSAGTADARHMTFDSELGEIDLEVRAVGPGLFRVTGQIAPVSPAGAELGFRRVDALESKTVEIDASGRFAFQIDRGGWELRIQVAGRVCALPRIEAG